jgi:hypothetical protein
MQHEIPGYRGPALGRSAARVTQLVQRVGAVGCVLAMFSADVASPLDSEFELLRSHSILLSSMKSR